MKRLIKGHNCIGYLMADEEECGTLFFETPVILLPPPSSCITLVSSYIASFWWASDKCLSNFSARCEDTSKLYSRSSTLFFSSAISVSVASSLSCSSATYYNKIKHVFFRVCTEGLNFFPFCIKQCKKCTFSSRKCRVKRRTRFLRFWFRW